MGTSAREDDPPLRLQYYRETGQTEEAKQYESYLRETGHLREAPKAAAPVMAPRESTAVNAQPKKSTTGPLDFLAPVAQGMTLGAADEILGAVEGADRALHGGSFKQGYVEGRDKVRAGTRAYERENPGASTALTLAGGVAPAVLGPGKALVTGGQSLLRRLLLSGAEGAGVGAVTGALSADDDRTSGAVSGGVVGGVLGGAIPVAGAGVNLARNVIGRRGAEAARHADALVTRALQRDQVNPGALVAPAGKPVILADMAGENTLGLARGAQATPSAAKNQLAELLHSRQAEQPQRVLADLESAAGMQNQNVHDVAEQLIEQRRANAKPLYDQAYAAPPITDPDVVETISRSKYLRQAYQLGRQQAREEGIKLPGLPRRAKPVPEAAAPVAPEPAPDLTKRARTDSGRLYANLEKASDEELANEYAALQNANAVENTAPTSLEGDSGAYQWVGQKTGAAHAEGRIAQRKKSIAKVEAELERRGIKPEDAMWMAGANAGDDVAGEAIEAAALSADDVAGDASFEFGKNVEPPAKKTRPFKGLPVQAIDYTKRGADALIERKYRGGSMDRNLARIIRNKVRSVLETVDDVVPEYKDARAQFAGDSEMIEALETGRKFLQEDYRVTQKMLGRMSPGERDMHRVGAVDAIRQAIDKAPDGADVVKRIFGNQAKRDQLKALLGPAFDDLESSLGIESRMVRTKDKVLGGSPTARIATELNELGETSALPVIRDLLYANPKVAAARAAITAVNARGRGNVGQVAEEVAKRMMLRPGSPEYQQWMALLARMPAEELRKALPRAVARRALVSGATNRE